MKSIKFFIIVNVLLIFSLSIQAQELINLKSINLSGDKNITVQQLATSSESSSFYIQIQDSVSMHYHETHTETLYVIDGEAFMKLGDLEFLIKAGDFIEIPKNTEHAVWVKSDLPLKVLSVQAPEFIGKDRIFRANK